VRSRRSGRVRFTIDARAPDDERLARLIQEIGIEGGTTVAPTAFSGAPLDAVRGAIEARGLRAAELASGAGHDAGVLARAGVPATMLFVRAGNGGVSHSPDEYATPEDVALAVDVLTEALERLAST
jgi:beta-ureidopropionase / N-carbamoyl-L-amino-acid hydrolase